MADTWPNQDTKPCSLMLDPVSLTLVFCCLDDSPIERQPVRSKSRVIPTLKGRGLYKTTNVRSTDHRGAALVSLPRTCAVGDTESELGW